MSRALSLFVIVFSYNNLFASSGDGVPVVTVVNQVINLSLLIALIYFTQGKTIAEVFKSKKEDFLKSVEEATASKKAAEEKFAEVSKRVDEMQNTFSQQIEEAKNNAEESYRDQLAKAKNEALRLKSASQTNLEFEIQKQVESLRLETFKKSANMAEEKLEKVLTPEQQKAWNSHFVADKQGAH